MRASTVGHAAWAGHRRRSREARTALASDAIVADARAEVTHRVDIQAPPEDVWPWLVQMGRRRGGWYSWDRLDNGGVPSAERIVPELQTIAVGDVLPVKASGPEGFAVLAIDPPRALVLGDASLLPGRPQPPSRAPRGTWAFELEPIGEAATRLFVRVRVAYEPTVVATLLRPLIQGLHAIMERKQLRTIRERAERGRRAPREDARIRIRDLVGVGDRIMALSLPFAVAGLVSNVLWPAVFQMELGRAGAISGAALLAIGVPLWLIAAVQVLVFVPRGALITRGPFALVLHPIYTSVALLVIPGLGLVFDSWLGFVVGALFYAASRRFAPSEERDMAARFPREYAAYRKRVLLPWL